MEAKLLAAVLIIIVIIGFALYGVAAAASNIKFEQRVKNHEKVWAEYTQQRQR